MSTIFLDSFSGAAADLPKRQHKYGDAVMRALLRDPRVSCFDRSECPTLERTLQDLKKRGLIGEVKEPYPWCRFHVTPEGLEVLAAINIATNPRSLK